MWCVEHEKKVNGEHMEECGQLSKMTRELVKKVR